MKVSNETKQAIANAGLCVGKQGLAILESLDNQGQLDQVKRWRAHANTADRFEARQCSMAEALDGREFCYSSEHGGMLTVEHDGRIQCDKMPRADYDAGIAMREENGGFNRKWRELVFDEDKSVSNAAFAALHSC